MRILLLNYEFPPVGGGASSATFNTGRELVRRGHHVDVLAGGTHGQPEFEVLEGMHVYRVSGKRKSVHEAGLVAPFCYVYRARGVLGRLLAENRYHYGHFYFAIPTGLLAFKWRALTDTPYLVSLRGSDVPDYDPDASTINLLHRLLMPFTRSILRHAQWVVANSECLKRLALRSFGNQEIRTITNGVSSQDFAPPGTVVRDEDCLTALCVSRLIPRKGIVVLLDAFALCKCHRLRLQIVGAGPLQAQLQDHARSLGIDDRVQFVGAVASREIATFYQNADFLVHPALVESFSMTLLEAMSSGLPIIASAVGGIPELVQDQVNGFLITPNEAPPLAAAMEKMAGSEALRGRFAEVNRATILNRYTWSHITALYEKYYLSSDAP